jgi:hypothetical protein
MAASGSSFRAAASADPAISRDRLGRGVSQMTGQSSGIDDTRRRNPGGHYSIFDIPRDTTAFGDNSDAGNWRAEPTRIWSAPSSYGDSKQDPPMIQNTPSPPDVYLHNSANAFQRHTATSRFDTRPVPSSDMRAEPAPPLDSFVESPPSNRYAAYESQSDGRVPQAYGRNERAYWSGFEDGVQYERQRAAFVQRSGEVYDMTL